MRAQTLNTACQTLEGAFFGATAGKTAFLPRGFSFVCYWLGVEAEQFRCSISATSVTGDVCARDGVSYALDFCPLSHLVPSSTLEEWPVRAVTSEGWFQMETLVCV